MPSCNQQNYSINCNFHRASSKHLITLTPKIYPFFPKSLSKISSANGLPGLLPVGQVRRQRYLPEPKIYLSRTTGRGLFRALTYGQFYPLFSYFLAGYLCELPPSLFRDSEGVELFDIPHPIGRFVALPRSLSLSQKQRWHQFGDPHIRERVRVLSMRTKKIGTLTPMRVLRNKNSS